MGISFPRKGVEEETAKSIFINIKITLRGYKARTVDLLQRAIMIHGDNFSAVHHVMLLNANMSEIRQTLYIMAAIC